MGKKRNRLLKKRLAIQMPLSKAEIAEYDRLRLVDARIAFATRKARHDLNKIREEQGAIRSYVS